MSRTQWLEARDETFDQRLQAGGATALRGGAFKPRSSPYSFQGMGKKGLELLALARKETGLPIVTEALDAFLDSMPELDGMAAKAKRKG